MRWRMRVVVEVEVEQTPDLSVDLQSLHHLYHPIVSRLDPEQKGVDIPDIQLSANLFSSIFPYSQHIKKCRGSRNNNT